MKKVILYIKGKGYCQVSKNRTLRHNPIPEYYRSKDFQLFASLVSEEEIEEFKQLGYDVLIIK